MSVSYTHLDVYKRQFKYSEKPEGVRRRAGRSGCAGCGWHGGHPAACE